MTPTEAQQQWYREMRDLFTPHDSDLPRRVYRGILREDAEKLAALFERLALGHVSLFQNPEPRECRDQPANGIGTTWRPK